MTCTVFDGIDFACAGFLLLLVLTMIRDPTRRKPTQILLLSVLFLLSAIFTGVAARGWEMKSTAAADLLNVGFAVLSDILFTCSIIALCFYLHDVIKGSLLPFRVLVGVECTAIPAVTAARLLGFGWMPPLLWLLQFLLIAVSALLRGSSGKPEWGIPAVLIPAAVFCLIQSASPALPLAGPGISGTAFLICLNFHFASERELLNKELELSESKVRLMTQQISPHFLFNTLDTISNLCTENPAAVKPAINHLASYIRGNLDSLTDSKLIPFEKELAHTGEYLYLEQSGGGRRFTVEYAIGVRDFLLPSLTLEPLVENAVQYGIGTRTEGGIVRIETEEDPLEIRIRVKDDGHGWNSATDHQKERQSVGLNNVRTRLEALCEGKLICESSEEGTCMTIFLPKKRFV